MIYLTDLDLQYISSLTMEMDKSGYLEQSVTMRIPTHTNTHENPFVINTGQPVDKLLQAARKTLSDRRVNHIYRADP